MRVIPPWTRSAADLRGGSSSPRSVGVTPDPQHGQQQQQQQSAGPGLTVEAVHHDRGVGDGDDVSSASRIGDGGFAASGGVSASSAVRYDAW